MAGNEQFEYGFNIIYNHAMNILARNPDTQESLKFTEELVIKLKSFGLSEGYYHDRDALPGKNIFDELFRVTSGSKYTFVLFTKGFTENCWARYCNQAAFKKFLDNNKADRVIAIGYDIQPGDITQIHDLAIHIVFSSNMTDTERRKEWDKLRKRIVGESDDTDQVSCIPTTHPTDQAVSMPPYSLSSDNPVSETMAPGGTSVQSEEMKYVQAVYNRCHETFVENLDLSVMDKMVSDGFIKRQLYDDIQGAHTSSSEKRKALLEFLHHNKTTYDNLDYFKSVLEKYGQTNLVEVINIAEDLIVAARREKLEDSIVRTMEPKMASLTLDDNYNSLIHENPAGQSLSIPESPQVSLPAPPMPYTEKGKSQGSAAVAMTSRAGVPNVGWTADPNGSSNQSSVSAEPEVKKTEARPLESSPSMDHGSLRNQQNHFGSVSTQAYAASSSTVQCDVAPTMVESTITHPLDISLSQDILPLDTSLSQDTDLSMDHGSLGLLHSEPSRNQNKTGGDVAQSKADQSSTVPVNKGQSSTTPANADQSDISQSDADLSRTTNANSEQPNRAMVNVSQPSTMKSTAANSSGDQSSTVKSTAANSSGDQSSTVKSTAANSSGDQSSTMKSTAANSSGDQSSTVKSTAANSSSDQSSTVKSTAANSSGDQSSTMKSTAANSNGDQSSTVKSTVANSSGDQSSTMKSTAANSIGDQSIAVKSTLANSNGDQSSTAKSGEDIVDSPQSSTEPNRPSQIQINGQDPEQSKPSLDPSPSEASSFHDSGFSSVQESPIKSVASTPAGNVDRGQPDGFNADENISKHPETQMMEAKSEEQKVLGESASEPVFPPILESTVTPFAVSTTTQSPSQKLPCASSKPDVGMFNSAWKRFSLDVLSAFLRPDLAYNNLE